MVRQPLLRLEIHTYTQTTHTHTSTRTHTHSFAVLLRKQSPTNHLKPSLCKWDSIIIRRQQCGVLLVLALHSQSMAHRKSFNQPSNAAVQEVGRPIVRPWKAEPGGVLSRFFTFTCWALLALFLGEKDKGEWIKNTGKVWLGSVSLWAHQGAPCHLHSLAG